MSRIFIAVLVTIIGISFETQAQPDRWQQRIHYVMDVKLDVQTNMVTGKQTIKYTNNSPDTLNEIFFHVYWNAFQPNSSMDVRSRELGTKVVGRNRDGSDRLDWDGRVKDRIGTLAPNEIGYCTITSLSMNGVSLKPELYETIVKYSLPKPILPKQTVTLLSTFEAQVPVQIRRSGRDNAEGVRYSMSQWYPKVAEYDYTGWTPNPYIAREFYGVWGDYDVKITLDKNYKIGASGVLQNAAEIGWGYDKEGTALKNISGTQRSWHFKAQNVHDFVWAADEGYQHITRQTKGGPLLHFIFKSPNPNDSNWIKTANECARAYPFIKENFGAYPWPVYSFIQGGDGGMEYAMATLVKNASLGTAIHEWMHSWYQHLLGTNESLYAWMDEGFTTYAESLTTNWLKGKKNYLLDGSYASYIALAKSKFEEPMTTHADHYATNYGYSTDAYSKGAVFLGQLGYIISDSLLQKTLLNYYQLWKFKHPNPNDFVRVAEKTSGIQLNWYYEYWVNTTKTIDYAIDSLWAGDEANATVRIRRLGEMPMPIDVTITFKDSTTERHYIPLDLMYGNKPNEGKDAVIAYPAQRWTHRTMVLVSKRKLTEIASVEIDPSRRMADIERKNNKLEIKW